MNPPILPEEQTATSEGEEGQFVGGLDQLAPGEIITGDVSLTAELDSVPVAYGVKVAEPKARSQWELVLRRFLHHRLAIFSLLVLVVLFALCFLAGSVAPYPLNPNPLPLLQANHGPSAAHWFGTDELGRDQLTRILYALSLIHI